MSKFIQVSAPTAWILSNTAFIKLHSKDSHTTVVTKYFANVTTLFLQCMRQPNMARFTCTGLTGRSYIIQDMLEEKITGLAVIYHAGLSFFEAHITTSSVGHVPDSPPSWKWSHSPPENVQYWSKICCPEILCCLYCYQGFWGRNWPLEGFSLWNSDKFDPSSHLDVMDLLCPPSCLLLPPLLLWTRTWINRTTIT